MNGTDVGMFGAPLSNAVDGLLDIVRFATADDVLATNHGCCCCCIGMDFMVVCVAIVIFDTIPDENRSDVFHGTIQYFVPTRVLLSTLEVRLA